MDKARVAVLISGRGSNMAALVYAAKADDCPYEVVLVSGDKPGSAGFTLAEAEGVPTLRLDRKALGADYWSTLERALEKADVEIVALAGFMRVIPADVVERWAGRIINIHPSLLPKYKGLHTHQAAIDAGDTVTGATVHLVVPDVDSGEILGQVEVAILADDTEDSLETRVLIAEHQLYPRILARFAALPYNAAWIEGRIDALASALPEVHRKTSHGAPGWGVGTAKSAKNFAIISDCFHGEEFVGLLVKASGPDEMTSLIESQPDLYYWPKYYGAAGWLGIKMSRRNVDWDHVRTWLERSWQSCAPPRLKKFTRPIDAF